jgi:hypothetical protein
MDKRYRNGYENQREVENKWLNKQISGRICERRLSSPRDVVLRRKEERKDGKMYFSRIVYEIFLFFVVGESSYFNRGLSHSIFF